MMLEALMALIQREIDSIEHAILTGACPDYTTYREQVGALQAYRRAGDLAMQAFKADEDDDT